MGLHSVLSPPPPPLQLALLKDASNKENAPPNAPLLRGRIQKKKRSPRRRRRIPLQDITHLCNRYLHLPLAHPIPDSSASSFPWDCNLSRKKRCVDGDGADEASPAHAIVSLILRKEFR
ncbi:hypothetical protein AXF42_Ash003211 [Apostasia shenzhenica]|uniref:Uncharacterized protein n=1 Tax=Apostasia shenzhenica TaxID=1088818 RepID=A0A2I0BFG5_9ASPA|nr:hypothetical protein AXF42_Ash003211 [Apostasia shenzhenica]